MMEGRVSYPSDSFEHVNSFRRLNACEKPPDSEVSNCLQRRDFLSPKRILNYNAAGRLFESERKSTTNLAAKSKDDVNTESIRRDKGASFLEKKNACKQKLRNSYDDNEERLSPSRKNEKTQIESLFSNYFDDGRKLDGWSVERSARSPTYGHRLAPRIDTKYRRSCDDLRSRSKENCKVSIFDERDNYRKENCNRDRYGKSTSHSSSLKDAFRMVSAKMDKSEKCSMSVGTQRVSVQGVNCLDDNSVLELDCQEFERDEQFSNMPFNARYRENIAKANADKGSFQQLFSLQNNSSLPQDTESILGLVSLKSHNEKELAFCFSNTEKLPAISMTAGLSRAHVTTVVRNTGTGLEIERRACTAIFDVPDLSENKQLNLCMQHEHPRIKNRTINWVKSQRLLQKRIKV